MLNAAVMVLQAVVLVSILATLLPRTRDLVRWWNLRNGLGAVRRSTWIKSTGIALIAAYALAVRAWPDLPDHEPWLPVVVWGVEAIGAVYVMTLYFGTIARHERALLQAQHVEQGQEDQAG